MCSVDSSYTTSTEWNINTKYLQDNIVVCDVRIWIQFYTTAVHLKLEGKLQNSIVRCYLEAKWNILNIQILYIKLVLFAYTWFAPRTSEHTSQTVDKSILAQEWTCPHQQYAGEASMARYVGKLVLAWNRHLDGQWDGKVETMHPLQAMLQTAFKTYRFSWTARCRCFKSVFRHLYMVHI